MVGVVILYGRRVVSSGACFSSRFVNAFAHCGAVEAVGIITDRDTGRSKGFGFVNDVRRGCGQSERAIEWVAA